MANRWQPCRTVQVQSREAESECMRRLAAQHLQEATDHIIAALLQMLDYRSMHVCTRWERQAYMSRCACSQSSVPALVWPPPPAAWHPAPVTIRLTDLAQVSMYQWAVVAPGAAACSAVLRAQRQLGRVHHAAVRPVVPIVILVSVRVTFCS